MQTRKAVSLCILFALFTVLAHPQQKNRIKADTDSPFQKTPLSYFVSANQNANPDAIWIESFDNTGFPPSGWLNQQISGTGLWTRVTSSAYPEGYLPHSGAGMACFPSWSFPTGTSAVLISSVFSLAAGQGRLSFWMLRDYGFLTAADKIDFLVNTTPSLTGATLLGTIYRSMYLTPPEEVSGWRYYEFAVPVSFNTSTNYIILEATSDYGNDMYIDDVGVSTIFANDVGVLSIDFPYSNIVPGSCIPKVKVRNFGSVTQTFPVTLTISPAGYTSTVTAANLAPDSTLQLSFATWAATTGSYNVKAITNLSTDQDRSNDTMQTNSNVSYAGWQAGTPLSTGSYMGSTALYKRNDTAWIFCTGGYNSLTMNKIYNTTTDNWSTGADLPIGNKLHSSAVLKDTLYIIGGYGTGTSATTTFLKYNIRTNTWSAGTDLPYPISWHKSVSYQDSLIYCVGGVDGTTATANVSLYNCYTNSWRFCSAMPVVRLGGALARTGDTLVYIAGANVSSVVESTYIGVISQADRSLITWFTKSQYPGGTMFRFDASSWRPGSIVVGGGSPTTAWTPASPNPCYVYKPSTDTWTQMLNLSIPVIGAYTCSFSQGYTYKFAIICGYNGMNSVTNNQILLDPGFVGIENNGNIIPDKYNLSQNYPNPFNPVTRIDFALPKSGNVTMKVYNILGKEVATLVNETKNAGNYTVSFNASNLSSGMYFYKIEANGFSEVKKMMLVK